MGAQTARGAQGIHIGEAVRRMKGANPRMGAGGFTTWDNIEVEGKKDKAARVSRSWSHYYPLVERRMNRGDVYAELERLELPYVINSMCDRCPHKGRTQWLRTSPEKIVEIAQQESRFDGQFFFTDKRRPLLEVIALYQNGESWLDSDADFECGNTVCGV